MSAPRVATAVAHPNIALAKYWGKKDGDGNVPAVPSLSVTLGGLSTTTTVSVDGGLGHDHFSLGGHVTGEAERERVRELLDRVRARSGSSDFAAVTSTNDFPTASGLASSASGFAALALAALRAYGVPATEADAADLARASSASAGRSLFGGYVELVPGEPARPVAPADQLPLRVLVCVTSEAAKSTSSRVGMNATKAHSPYYPAWVQSAEKNFKALRTALLARDLEAVGALAEQSALAMHASALAAGVVYFSGATLEAYREVQHLRKQGFFAFATMDAGPHVKVLVHERDAEALAKRLDAVPGVLRIIVAAPGEGARIV